MENKTFNLSDDLEASLQDDLALQQNWEESLKQILQDEYIANKYSIEELNKITNNCYDHLSFDDIFYLPYNAAKKVIDSITMYKRIELLNACETKRLSLYEHTQRYDEGLTFEESISRKEFLITMDKIKHLEILQGWLFGIE